ncbi:hypothetical protein BMS3Abin17_00315 [archaeon BMS3Abin17]|nr:hypothetical protein BMS3Abin17_00315 [archaeon BMS3Abin17]HDZ60817.1 hypothetical protein [Candidatus Pacearchaeota archaeon]
MDKKFLFLGGAVTLLILILSMYFVFGDLFNIDSATPRYINRSVNTLINFTINNTGALNITQVIIQLPDGANYSSGSNGTDVSPANFTTVSNRLIWTNTTAAGFIANTSEAKNFWFNVSFVTAGDKNFTIITNDTSLTGNTTTHVLTVNFAFSGFVRNETGGNESNVNVSIYQFAEGQNGPPTETFEASVLTNANGIFSFASINGSASNYLLKMIRYGPASGCVNSNSTCNATKTGTILPPFPAMLYYPMSGGFDMSLNGSAFYLQEAATLRLYAYNSSNASVNFGYEVIDQKVGFPVASNIMGNVPTVDVVVPAGKSYTVMMLRDFSQFGNDASPPLSNSSLGTISAGNLIIVNQSLATSNYRLYGCINISSGNNNSLLNVTNIKLKMAPWTTDSGMFIPPMDADQGNINVSNPFQLNNSNMSGGVSCPGSLAAYNISVIGSTSPGITYLVEAYAKNASDEAGNPGNANVLAAFQNISITADTNFNLTLYKLAGSYYNDSTSGVSKINTSYMKINIVNDSGDAVTTSMHVEVSVKNSNAGIGTVNYMVEELTNGVFYLPILNNSDWAEVAVFPNDGPPMVKKLNLSANENNITLISIDSGAGGDKGLRQMAANGSLVQVNASAMPIQLRFLRRGTNDVITSMNASDFNPLKALVAGSIDLELKVIATNVTMKFNNFDMFSAKQPPMFAVMDNNSMGSSSQSWKFGNFVPKDVYDNVTLIIPYSSAVDESWIYNMSVPVLYQEDQSTTHQLEVGWDSTRGDTAVNLTDEFIDYNNSAGGRYRNYLTSGGVQCSKTDATSICYMNTSSNQFYMEIPHFSGLSPSIAGLAPASSSPSSSPSSGTGVGGGWTYTIKDDDFKTGYIKNIKVKDRFKFTVENETHYVKLIELTNTTAIINVSSEMQQQASLSIGDMRKFEVTNDSYYDLSVTLNSIGSKKANFTILSIHEEVTPETIAEEEGKEKVAKGEEEGGIAEGKDLTWLWVVIGIIILAIIIGGGIAVKRKRK